MLDIVRIYELAGQRGLPDTGLAEALARELARAGYDVSAATIGRWLRGETEPRGRLLVALAQLLGCRPEELLGVGK